MSIESKKKREEEKPYYKSTRKLRFATFHFKKYLFCFNPFFILKVPFGSILIRKNRKIYIFYFRTIRVSP